MQEKLYTHRESEEDLMIIPRVKSEKYSGKSFALPEKVTVSIDSEEALIALDALRLFLPDISFELSDNGILKLERASFEREEAYSIVIDDAGISVAYADRLGARNAAASLAQLWQDGSLPECEIEDWPEFSVRSFMLDLARGLGRKEEIRELVVHLAAFKYNRLHLHLIDGQGVAWQSRIYPELTGPRGDQYSMQYFKSLGELCNSLGIEVLPEVEVPGHNKTILKCYPELACEVDEETHPAKWVLCAGNEEIFTFYKNIIGELIEMFPRSPVIHIGGDEVDFGDIESQRCYWLDCPRCMSLGFSSMQEIYYYVIKRVYDIVRAYGKEVAMWSDWIDTSKPSPLPRDIQINFWRVAMEGRGPFEGCSFENFLSQGYKVVNAFYEYTYIDEPDYMTAEKLNDWSPTKIPESAEKYHANILGGESCAWEYGNEERYRFYRFTIHSQVGMFADRLWNTSVVPYDEKYERTLTRAIIGQRCPQDFNIFGHLGTIMLKAQTKELAVINENTPSDDVLRAAILALAPAATSDSYGHAAALSYVECLNWIIDNR